MTDEAPHNLDKTEKAGAAVCICGHEAPDLYALLSHIGEGNKQFHEMKRGEHARNLEQTTTRPRR